MQETEERFAFEKFPRDDITFKITRREFWSALMGNWSVLRSKGRGIPAYSLADLGSLPDEQLASLIPEVVPGCEIAMHDGFVWGRAPSAHQPVVLFPDDAPALAAFNLFNGMTTLQDVSLRLSEGTEWDSVRSFAYTRGLFLSLVLAGICQPRF